MEVSALASGLAGAGYYLNQNHARVRNVSGDNLIKAPQLSYTSSIYSNPIFETARDIDCVKAQNYWEKSKHPNQTNIIPPEFNQRTFANEGASQYPIRPENTRVANQRESDFGIEQFSNMPSSLQTFQQQPAPVMTMAGVALPASKFTHNNMQPFFGSRVRQNIEGHGNQATLELFTGTSSLDIKKQEIQPLFAPQKNLTYVHGSSVYDQQVSDRFIPSRFRQGEKPIQDIHVGPGLNKGYTSQPSGGFQQADSMQYSMPKTVDELRTVNNPKISYDGMVIPGHGPTQRGLVSGVNKNKPETSWVMGPDRYFTTVGAYTKPTDQPLYDAKMTNRQTETQEYIGTAAPAVVVAPMMEQKYKETQRQVLKPEGFRNLDAEGRRVTDYGKNSIRVDETERDTTQDNNYLSNFTTLVKALIAPIQDLLKPTRKEDAIGNIRQTGNMQSSFKQLPVHDPNDIAKTTIKETNIHNERLGNIGGLDNRGVVHDPTDTARTTIKETNIHNERLGNIGGLDNRGTVHDPSDTARTTIKETNIHNERLGNVGGLDNRGTVYDPSNLARTTIKETNIHNERVGNVGGLDNRGVVYDPSNLAKTTIKETNIHNEHIGFLVGPKLLSVYDPSNLARTTLKETNIHNERLGNIGGLENRGAVYDPSNLARTTIKETNIHNERLGNIGGLDNRGIAYDPNAIARPTIKETMLGLNDGNRNLKGEHVKPTVHNPNDVPKTTMKETTIDDGHMGDAVHNLGMGYVTNPQYAPVTIRETTEQLDYMGDAVGPEQGGYEVVDAVPRPTQRQDLADNAYSGDAVAEHKHPMSYQDAYNANVNIVKEVIAEGRAPTNSNVKLTVGANDVNMSIFKYSNDEPNYRTNMITKIIDLGPERDECGITKTKQNYMDVGIERINPVYVEQFVNNPFTQPLDSATMH